MQGLLGTRLWVLATKTSSAFEDNRRNRCCGQPHSQQDVRGAFCTERSNRLSTGNRHFIQEKVDFKVSCCFVHVLNSVKIYKFRPRGFYGTVNMIIAWRFVHSATCLHWLTREPTQGDTWDGLTHRWLTMITWQKILLLPGSVAGQTWNYHQSSHRTNEGWKEFRVHSCG